MNFADILTCSRASNSWAFNSSGILAPTANDLPAYAFNPVTGAARGLFVQEGRTNVFLNAGNAVGGTFGTGTATGPAGTAMRKFIVNSGVANFPSFGHSEAALSTVNGSTQDFAFSGFFSASLVGSVTLEPMLVVEANIDHTSAFVYANAQIDTTTWAIRSKQLGSRYTEVAAPVITALPGGIYYVTWVVRFTQDATARNKIKGYIQIRDSAGSGTYTADGTSAIQYDYVQAELGNYPTTPIPTTGANVSRAADVITAPLGSWFNPVEGTIFIEAEMPMFTTAGMYPSFFAMRQGLSNSLTTIEIFAADGWITGLIRDGGADQAAFGKPVTPGSIFKAALAYKANDFAMCVNGATPAIDGSGTVPTVDTMRVGSNTATAQINSCIRKLMVRKSRMSNADLQALTA